MKETSAEKTITDEKQRQWLPEGDQGKRTESGYTNKALDTSKQFS